MTWVENLILAIVEGLTEYLPVSSTGHLMMTGEFLGLDLKKIDTYIISVQFGAIFAVVVLYWKKFVSIFSGKKDALQFYLKLLLGFIPAAILGFLLDDYLEKILQTPVIVGITLVVVGVFLLFIDRVLPGGEKTVDTMHYKDAIIIGTVQSFAMIPGVSRSAASIAGALGCKLNKMAATEFSFFLAVPTLTAAGAYKLLKNWDALSSKQLNDIAIGNVISFITALIAVKFFIGLVKKRGFAWFGIYRVIVGLFFLFWLSTHS
jgi:undecaprenyl-diphosphatase